MKEYPTGTVTFLFTDIEGSTQLWERYPDAMRSALARHDEIIEGSVELQHGLVVRPRGEGDSRFAVFTQAEEAVRAGMEIMQKLAGGFADLPFGLKVRIGMHTGSADLRMGDYYGSAVNRCARIRGLGHGGQMLLSQVTAELVQDDLPEGVRLIDMGTHQLKGLSRGERIFQLSIPGLPNDFPPLEAAAGVDNNLPAQPTPFIGRKTQIGAIKKLLLDPDVRLVTLLGPGGTGKTRLSLQVAQELPDSFPQGEFFVPLAEDTDAHQLIARVAQQLEVREAGRPLLENVKDYLRDKRLLLILDNFEQLVSAAPIVSDVLAAAPQLKILVSSRIALQLRGEREYPVPPLALPETQNDLTLESLAENESVRLFVERARAAQPNFNLTPDNAAAVADICRRLDGLPLALELAAARVKVLSPQAILARLDDRLKLLTGGARDLPARHQALRNTLEWSYGLLKPEEKILYDRLGVFAGGFTLEAVEAVCNPDGSLDILEGLTSLANNSLLRQEETEGGDPRFVMLETIRAYALEKLTESGETAAMQARHARYFGGVVIDQAGSQLYSANALYWLNWLGREIDNIRAALTWAVAAADAPEIAAGLVWGLLWFYYRRGYVSEGRMWTERVLALPEVQKAPPLHVLALIADGMLALWLGEQQAGLAHLREGLAIEQRLEDERMMAPLLLGNGVALINMGRDGEAQPFLEEAQALFKQHNHAYFHIFTVIHLGNVELGLGNPEKARAMHAEAYAEAQAIDDRWLLSFALNNLGEVARTQGQYDQARTYYEACEAYLRDTGDRGDLARFAHSLGYVAQYEGDYAGAEAQFRQSLVMFRRLGNRRGMAECMAGLAGLKARQGQAEWGAIMLSAAESVLKVTGGAWWPADRVEVDRNQEIIHSSLNEDDLLAAQKKGGGMTLEQALAFASEGS
jgi:predicted ATPase/class 3 adenylate cyclase